MKGANTVPCVNINKEPNIKKMIIIGNNQYFFLEIINFKSSLINSIIKTGYLGLNKFHLFLKSNYF